MTGGSDTQSKLRAAILAFVMVTSMMVGTVALTGSAAADPSNEDTTGPSIQTVELDDAGNNNKIYVTFDEPVYANADRTGGLKEEDFTYTDVVGNDNGADSVSSVTHSAGDQVALLTMDSTTNANDASDPDTLAAAADSIFDGSGNAADTTAADVGNNAPQIVAVEGEQGSTTVTVTFSEGVGDDTQGDLATGDFNIGNGIGFGSISHSAGTQSKAGAIATITTSSDVSAGDIGTATVAPTDSSTIEDDADSTDFVGTSPVNLADNTEPHIDSTSTADTNNDGNVDQISVTLSEPIDDDESSTDSAFTLSSGSVTSVGGVGGSDDASVTLTVSGLSGTDPTPDVILAPDTLEDTQTSGVAAGNVHVFSGTSDSARPVITGFSGSVGSGTATVTFSEPVDDNGGNLETADFTLTDNSGNGVGTTVVAVSHSAPSDTATLTLDSDIISDDIGLDSVEPDDPGDIRDTSSNDNNAVVIARTLKSPSLAAGPVAGAEYQVGGDATADVVVGSANETLGEIRLRDNPGDGSAAFGGSTELTFPEGVTINTSASELTNANVLTSDNDGVDVTDVSVTNNDRTITLDHSGTSNEGETLRIASGAVVLNVDGTAISSTVSDATLDAEINTFSGTQETSFLTLKSPSVTATSKNTITAGGEDLGGSASVTINSNQITKSIEGGSGTDLIGNQTELVFSLEEGTGVNFDAGDIDKSNLLANTDIDGDGTNDLNQNGITVTDKEITVPVVDSLTDSGGATNNIIFRNQKFETAGDAEATDLNVTLEAPESSAGPYIIDSNDAAPETVGDYISLNVPDVEVDTSTDQLAVGQDETRLSEGSIASGVALQVTATTGDQISAGTNVTLRLNSTNATFDTSLGTQNSIDNDNEQLEAAFTDSNDVSVGDISISENKVEVSVNDAGNDGQLDSTESLQFGDIRLNASRSGLDDEVIAFEAITRSGPGSPEVTSVSTNSGTASNQVVTLQRPNFELNDADTDSDFDADGSSSNITVNLDNDGIQQQNIVGTNDALTIESNIKGQIVDETNVTITLEENTGVTFDTTAGATIDQGTLVNSNDDQNFDVNVQDSDFPDDPGQITVTEKAIEIRLLDGDNDGPDEQVDTGDSNNILLDDIVLNATGDAQETELSVTTNATVTSDQSDVSDGDNEQTTVLSEVINFNRVNPQNVFVNADVDETTNAGSRLSNEFGQGSTDATDASVAVGSGVNSSVLVQSGNDNDFGGAQVSLELIDQPDGSNLSAFDLLNTTSLTTDSNGLAGVNFTAPGDVVTGDYVVNATTTNTSQNITYAVTPGDAAQFNVSSFDPAVIDQSGLSGSPSETATAAVKVRVEDSGGNLVGDTDVDVNVDVSGGQLETVTSDISDDGTTAGNPVDDNGDNSRRDYQPTNNNAGDHTGDPTKGDFYVFVSSTSPGEVDVTVSESTVSDTGTTTIFDAVDTVVVEPESTSVAPGSTLNVTATAQTSDGTTIEVPRLALNDLSSNDTDVLERTSLSEEATGGTFANGTVAATFDAAGLGTAELTADIAGTTATETITVTDQAEPAPVSDPVERFDTNGEPGIQDDEVLNAISAFNEGEEGVEDGDVLDVISAFNEA